MLLFLPFLPPFSYICSLYPMIMARPSKISHTQNAARAKFLQLSILPPTPCFLYLFCKIISYPCCYTIIIMPPVYCHQSTDQSVCTVRGCLVAKALAGANQALSWQEEFPNSLVLEQSGVWGYILGICSCIIICYLRPCQSPNCWSFPVLFEVLLQHTKHGFIPLQLHCQPGFPAWVSRFLMCMIPRTVWPSGL